MKFLPDFLHGYMKAWLLIFKIQSIGNNEFNGSFSNILTYMSSFMILLGLTGYFFISLFLLKLTDSFLNVMKIQHSIRPIQNPVKQPR